MASYTSSDGTTAIWKGWVDISSTSTYASSSNNVWGIWCNETTSTASTSATVIWRTWNDQPVYVAGGNSVVYEYKPAPETEEQRQARLAREEQYRIAEEARKKAEAEAKEKAERLLVSQLNPAQLKQLKEMDAFIVELETRRYKIRRNNRVLELDKEGRQVWQYCIHPSDYQVPPADVMLAQKLLLEHDEAAFLRIANRSAPPRV